MLHGVRYTRIASFAREIEMEWEDRFWAKVDKTGDCWLMRLLLKRRTWAHVSEWGADALPV